MNCRQVTRLVSQAMDTRLSCYQRLGVRLHLVYCVWCRRYAAQLRFLRKSVSTLSRLPPEAGTTRLTTEAKEQMRQRLRQALKEQGPPS